MSYLIYVFPFLRDQYREKKYFTIKLDPDSDQFDCQSTLTILWNHLNSWWVHFRG